MSKHDFISPYFPVYADARAPAGLAAPDGATILDPATSAILGGSAPALNAGEAWPRCGECKRRLIPYIQINLASPNTPEPFRQRIAPAVRRALALEEDAAERARGGGAAGGGGGGGGGVTTPVLQVLLCAEDENADCFERCVVSDPDGTAWLVRIVHLDGAAGIAARAEVDDDDDDDRFFVPERVIAAWSAGNPELEHEAVAMWEDADEELYKQHAPAEGLKLLGWPVQGKFYTCKESCVEDRTAGNVEHVYRGCLLQLGTHASWDEEKEDVAETPISTVGNTWISQCDRHPELLDMAIGGDW